MFSEDRFAAPMNEAVYDGRGWYMQDKSESHGLGEPMKPQTKPVAE